MKQTWKRDCKHFIGNLPCKNIKKHNFLDCSECSLYEKISKKILIIKLGRMGDVLRTTCILPALKKDNSYIIWLVGEESYDLLKNNPLIDEVLIYNTDSVLRLQYQEFDVLINLDIDLPSIAIANSTKSKEKLGYGMDKDGKTICFNPEAEYLLEIALSDKLKRANKKLYQEQIFDAIKLPYNKEEYILNLPEIDQKFAEEFIRKYNIKSTDLIIGLNTGSGSTWPMKKWTIEGFARLIDRLNSELNAKVILLGGMFEIERNYELYRRQLIDNNYKIKTNAKTPIIDTTHNNDVSEFAYLIHLCNVIVTGDTAAMHIALALKKPVVALFGPTAASEIDDYGRMIKIISPIDCICCYKRNCDKVQNCMDLISVDAVFDSIKALLNKS